MRYWATGLIAALSFTGCDKQGAVPSVLPEPLARSYFGGFTCVSKDDRAGVTLITLTNAGWTVKIEVMDDVDPPDADTLTRDGLMGIEALYAHALSPYPGDISRQVSGDQRFAPKPVKLQLGGRTENGFLLFANDRFGYGAMTQDAASYKSLVAWLYCANRRELYKLRVFCPLSTGDQDIIRRVEDLRCQ